MTDNSDLQVELDGLNIIVTMSGTSFRVAYRMAEGYDWLTVSDYEHDSHPNGRHQRL